MTNLREVARDMYDRCAHLRAEIISLKSDRDLGPKNTAALLFVESNAELANKFARAALDASDPAFALRCAASTLGNALDALKDVAPDKRARMVVAENLIAAMIKVVNSSLEDA